MENQNNNFNIQPTEEVINLNPKRSWWKYALGMTAIIVFIFSGYALWHQYFSAEAKYRQEVEKSALALPAKLEAYKKAMEEDTYGGKTPEETLQLFIDALKKEDVELASKYFALDDDTARTDEKWLNGLVKAKEQNKLANIADELEQGSEPSSNAAPFEGYYRFSVKDKSGNYLTPVVMKLNKYSGVWKIESL